MIFLLVCCGNNQVIFDHGWVVLKWYTSGISIGYSFSMDGMDEEKFQVNQDFIGSFTDFDT